MHSVSRYVLVVLVHFLFLFLRWAFETMTINRVEVCTWSTFCFCFKMTFETMTINPVCFLFFPVSVLRCSHWLVLRPFIIIIMVLKIYTLFVLRRDSRHFIINLSCPCWLPYQFCDVLIWLVLWPLMFVLWFCNPECVRYALQAVFHHVTADFVLCLENWMNVVLGASDLAICVQCVLRQCRVVALYDVWRHVVRAGMK